jgi:hypothetical protein
MSFTPKDGGKSQPPQAYIGTFRVTGTPPETPRRVTGKRRKTPPRASGDLYVLNAPSRPGTPAVDTPEELITQALGTAGLPLLPSAEFNSILESLRPRSPIPSFPVEDYRYYLEVLSISEEGAGLNLEVAAHEYDSEAKTLEPHIKLQARLRGTRGGKSYTGQLVNGEEERGKFHLQWISPFVRQAKLRLFALSPQTSTRVKLPGLKTAGMDAALAKAQAKNLDGCSSASKDGVAGRKVPTWEGLFKDIHWKVKLTEFKDAKAPVGQDAWTPYDLSDMGQRLREEVDPNDWTYDLLCVSSFEGSQYLGIMFDAEATDLNERPRESAAVAALQVVNFDGAEKCFQDVLGGAAYYRTALHEVGHAMNLTHNFRERSLMNTTGPLIQPRVKAKLGQPAVPLKFDVAWHFSADEAEWLQHAPDIAVRPGGISRRGVRFHQEMRPVPPALTFKDAAELILELEPVVEEFPFGAPIRLNYLLRNCGPELEVPQDISLRGGHVMGRVTGPDRVTRFFRSAFRCCDTATKDHELARLKSGETVAEGMTILRGIDYPLFPEPGAYQIELEIRWDADNQTNRVVGHANVTVTAADPKDHAQAIAAALILNDSAMMPALVQGLINPKGLRALSLALRSTTLAPHYLAIALKCKIMGAKRRTNWDRKLGAKVRRVSILPRPSAFGLQRKIVQTWREEKQLRPEEKQLPREEKQLRREVNPTHSASGRRGGLQKLNSSEVALTKTTNGWLNRVHDFTT